MFKTDSRSLIGGQILTNFFFNRKFNIFSDEKLSKRVYFPGFTHFSVIFMTLLLLYVIHFYYKRKMSSGKAKEENTTFTGC